MQEKIYDVVIVGGGPAGLTAAVYAKRYNLNTLVVSSFIGGMILEAYEICNFPSYQTISGVDLAKSMINQVKNLGIELKKEIVKKINKKDKIFGITTNNSAYRAKKIILATGTEKRRLNIGEDKFLGKGVSYCATCDARFFKNKDVVAVIGGGDAALTAALLLSEYVDQVYIIYRKEKFFRGDPSWIKQAEENKKIKPIFNTQIKKIYGKEKVERIKLDNGSDLKVDGVFIEIGSIPNEKFSKQIGLKTDKGYIMVNKKQESSIEGVYAAGDITNNHLKQAVTAAAEGAIAASSSYTQIRSEKNKKEGGK